LKFQETKGDDSIDEQNMQKLERAIKPLLVKEDAMYKIINGEHLCSILCSGEL